MQLRGFTALRRDTALWIVWRSGGIRRRHGRGWRADGSGCVGRFRFVCRMGVAVLAHVREPAAGRSLGVDYLTLKALHVGSVAATYTLFVLRGVWMISQSPFLARTWVRVMPHVIDTVLLASAIALAVMLRQNPLVAYWLAAKIVGLVIYIALGTITLKRGRSKRARIAAWIAAQGVFGYIVAVALTRNPLPWA